MKVSKAILSWVLTLCMLATPFCGITVFAAGENPPTITFNLDPYDYITPDQEITVSYAPNGDATLTACDTRLEGISLSADATVSFTPEEQSLTEGTYTLVATATDSNGATATKLLTFIVADKVDIDFVYDENENIVPSVDNAVAGLYEVESLNYSMSYGTSTDGTVDYNNALPYGADKTYALRYLGMSVENSSSTGIPYQIFNVELNGKTEGEIAVRYTGATYAAERIALSVYNPTSGEWDVLGTFMGSDSVSSEVDIATYNDGDVIRVMAMLDYVTNGSDTMIWSTDPQHYTKFDDLNEYYYRVYQYAAEQYLAGEAGYIITTGDLVDDRPTAAVAAKQWSVADKAMQYVEAVGMPNGLVSGNHDVGDFKKPDYSAGAPNVDYSMFYKTFPASRYNDQRWYGGSLNNNASHYDLITIGNVDFVVLYLGYGVEATDETIIWANDVLERYSHRTAIVTTHQYLDAGSAVRSSASRAQLIFDKIVDPNPNVKVVLCGHDDGSLCLEKTASDGRTVYEILSDYQFVEAEDPDFYENEHYIGSVPSCCGDGYIRLMTVTGNTLSSITYSPVTGRYNPYGDRENLQIDLGDTSADRYMDTVSFSAYVVGDEITEGFPTTDSAIIISKQVEAEDTTEPEVPVEVNEPATPDNPYMAHAADYIPNVQYKVDILNAIGKSNGYIASYYQTHGAQSLGLQIDLTKTPYLYYSITQPEESNFTFAFNNNSNMAPWLLFRDATGEGAYMNNGNANWDSYKENEQYLTTSETGCIDLRDYSTDPAKAKWVINQVNFYNTLGKDVSVDYMFAGSEPIEAEPEAPAMSTAYKTYHHVAYYIEPDAPAETVTAPVDLANYNALVDYAEALDLTPYTEDTAAAVNEALNASLSENPTNDEIAELYTDLINAIGALKVYVEPIDDTNLVSMHNYNMDYTKWYNQDANVPIGNYASHITVTATENGGMHMTRSAASTNTWPSAIYKGASSITLKPNNGKIYVKLDVVADSCWCIYLDAQQGNSSAAVRLNFAIDNAFNRTDTDGYQGTYKGVYDVTEAFVANGFDPNATIKINRSILYIVPGDVTYDYFELLTDPSAGEVDKSILQGLLDEAATLVQEQYTSATWTKLVKAVNKANTAINNAESAQSDINLEVINMKAALAQLKKVEDVIEEPANSLLPADEGKWTPNVADTMNIFRDESKYTVFQNTNNQWPFATYTLPTPYTTTASDHQITVDVTVGSEASILLNINNTFFPINKYISSNVSSAGDLQAGTYSVSIPFSAMTELKGAEDLSISQVRVFSVGPADASKVTVRKLMVDEYVAPPHVEDECHNLIPEKTEDVTIVSGDGTVEVKDGVLTVVNNGDTDLRVSFTDTDLFNLETLNALHMVIDSEPTFKMAYQINESAGSSTAWPNTSNFTKIFTITNDRAAAGKYDVHLEIRDNTASLASKDSNYFNQFIILLSGKGTFKLSTAEMISYDTFDWPAGYTYGEPATPSKPYAEHIAKNGPEVETKIDLMPYFNAGLHPNTTSELATASGLNIDLDLSKTPYLYYSVMIPEGGDFTFSIYSNSNYSPWLSFLDPSLGESKLNSGNDNWNASSAAGRAQYATTSFTGCIDLRDYLKTTQLKWIITQMKFYKSKGDAATVSYFYVGSAPIEKEPEAILGDVSGDGEISTMDALLLYAFANGSLDRDMDIAVADINKDGILNTMDALLLFGYASGALETL